ncbi:hypothetical protein STCU_06630 [Strigomonas culicis]|uniref:Uncharacterized protein n=1 Tax=Strigomonas culicis TaxID=28005 RepID=S9U9N5_9TRYP|nr:hypothetical protein STCU_06630 [Strigomonas culicis]|eukprot:EPY25613.1 hypothetical protein STCU_06630 [Strigomonas culicis]
MGSGPSVAVQEHFQRWEVALSQLEGIASANQKALEQDRLFGGAAEGRGVPAEEAPAPNSMRRPSSLISFTNNNANNAAAESVGASSSSIGQHRNRSRPTSPEARQLEVRQPFESTRGSTNAGSTAPPRHTRQQVLETKKVRQDLFASYVPKNPEKLTDFMPCSHFGATAVALSYLLGGKKDASDRRQRVTVEDIFFAAQVPLHMLHTGPPHLPVMADIVKEFLDVDNRFKDEYILDEVHFDVSPTVGQVELGPNEVGDRQTRMQLPEFCRSITRDCEEESHVIRVVNYDPYVLEQEMRVDAYEDDEDLSSALATSVLGNPRHQERVYSPHNDGAYAVIVDVRNAVQLMVTIAEGVVNDSLHVKLTEVSAASLFRAMMTAEEGHRARGFLRIAKKSSSGTGFMDDVSAFWTPELCSGKVLGTLRDGTHASAISHHISPHIVGVAWAMHLLAGTRENTHGYGNGLPVSDIIRTMHLPSEVFMNGILPLDQVYEYAKEYVHRRSKPITISLYPVLTKISREDAVPTISVFDLESILLDVRNANDDNESPSHVMLIMYNACVAHNVLYIAEEPQWCVLAGYDQETQTALLIDAHPKTFSRTWTCSLERLHKAMTGTGYMIFSKLPAEGAGKSASTAEHCVGAPSNMAPMVQSRLLLLQQQSRMGPLWETQTLVKTFTFPTLPVMPTIVAMVGSILLGKTITFDDVIHLLPYELSALIIRFFTLESMHVCLSKFLFYSGVADAIQVESFHGEKDASGKVRLPLSKFEELVGAAAGDKDKVLVVLYKASHLQVHGAHHPFGSLGIVTKYDSGKHSVTVTDCNPNSYLRTWSVPLQNLHEAITDEETEEKHRTLGCLLVSRGPRTQHNFKPENSRHFHLELIPIQNVFHVSPSPHFQGHVLRLRADGRVLQPRGDLLRGVPQDDGRPAPPRQPRPSRGGTWTCRCP